MFRLSGDCIIWECCMCVSWFFYDVWNTEEKKTQMCKYYSATVYWMASAFLINETKCASNISFNICQTNAEKTPRNKLLLLFYISNKIKRNQDNFRAQYLMLIFVSINSSHNNDTKIFIFILLHFFMPLILSWHQILFVYILYVYRIQHTQHTSSIAFDEQRFLFYCPLLSYWNQHFSLIVSEMSSLMLWNQN